MASLITIGVIAGRGAVLVTLSGDVTGEALVARMVAFLAERPDLAAWHRVYDMSLYTGSIGHADLQELARRMPPAALHDPAVTVIVTRDFFFRAWSRTFPLMAPGRVFHVVDRLDEAWACLPSRGGGAAGEGG
jgi:hypothetical protein